MEKEGTYIHFIETSNSVNKLAGDFEQILRFINFLKKGRRYIWRFVVIAEIGCRME
ncbi:MAG: hypothetical protein GX215_03440 [Clostridiales Family XIII bacterium]|jgi:hypothetical protein|nr:hypothetical protein [Clostridiales Family XIII bacterium]